MKRNDDFHRILSQLNIYNLEYDIGNQYTFDNLLKNNISVTDKFDFAFFMGDFNYRIDNNMNFIKNNLKNLDKLIEYDQMLIEIKNDKLKINNFKEGKIKFPPTYKIEPGTDNEYIYKAEEKMPGWTDRIL